ncbi:hypothetical protein SBOR_9635 [Sclerotinia borealis F-4128]|uniref:LipA and NB-ARC domain protein n=1 Tax=Sclerotinia borealis (strain F-4128) TaxID=1432307 RepID=W9C4Z5_SCLBF|nr:hypothetical protein SBOR_9635 [Sclerotinia borealis F-4128]
MNAQMNSYPSPPGYSEISESPQSRAGAKPSQIRRKPITPRSITATSSESNIIDLTKYGQDIRGNGATEGSSNINAALASGSQSLAVPITLADFETLQTTSTSTNIERTVSAPAAPLNLPNFDSLPGNTSETISEPSSTPSASSASSYVSKAYQEARHFAGGLIAHPSESTKHFSILRHSHGLVFYQGSSTTLAVSIFSDAPLPAGRQVWLQNKGWSGNTGMRLKAIVGNNGDWLNVTPSMAISPSQLKASDERAWQRDIKKFMKKTQHPKHILRETLVVRIPVSASDGYFHLVLCPNDKKKVLCPSPVFRILSASVTPASIRGASLSTLPLELGALAMTTYANNTIGKLISPVTSAAEKVAHPFMPSVAKKEAVMKLYGKSGTEDMVRSTVTNGNIQYHGIRSFSYNQAGSEESESGPSPPYPICFVARSEMGTSDADYFSMPTMNLSGIAEHISHQLRGHYCAWVRQRPGNGHTNIDSEWSQTVISSLPIQASGFSRATISQASRRIFKIHFISDQFEPHFYNHKNLDVKIMGFIRHDTLSNFSDPNLNTNHDHHHDLEEEVVASLNDIIFAQIILDQPLYAPENMGQMEWSTRGVLERATTGYAEVRLAAQRRVDRVPLGRLGLRMEVDGMRDRERGVGGLVNGFYVVR